MVNAPTNLSVKEVSNGFELSWSVNDNNTTGNIAIERSTDNGNTFSRVISGISRTTEIFTDSTNFDEDNPVYRIVRVTDDAESVSSEVEYTEPIVPEEIPVEETLESTVTDNGIELTWSSDETDGEFIVYRDTNSGTTGTDYTQIDTVPAFTFNQYLDSSVSSGERYYYRTEYSFIDAVGGNEFDVTIDGVDYRIHEFTSDGTFTVNQISSDKTVDVLIVGGGGSGGSDNEGGGGGGAGGMIDTTTDTSIDSLSLTERNYSVSVGQGGFSVTPNKAGNNGGNSSFAGLVALGGGGGGGHETDGGGVAKDGGSGGGGASQDSNLTSGRLGGNGLQPTSSSGGYGNDGGDTTFDSIDAGAGGGGAGSSGQDETADRAGDGGDGKISSITGNDIYYAGGGGGSVRNFDPEGAGGLGGGGDGSDGTGQSGVDGKGGGGGSGRSESGSGGDGIVLIRYKL